MSSNIISMKDFFLKYRDIAISLNYCFKNKSFLIPKVPLERNIVKISNKKINTELMREEIKNFNKWTNKDPFTHKWKSITLKSYNGENQDFLEKHYFGIKENNKFLYTENINHFLNIRFFLECLNCEIYLVRLLKLEKGGLIKYHTDGMVFREEKEIIRIHLPIITDEKNIVKIGYPLQEPAPGYSIWNAITFYKKNLEEGYLYYINVNTLHSVENRSEIDRVHLVIDLKPNNIIRNKLGII
jgi:hypothetical protein